MLHEFIALNRDEIIRRCKGKRAMRSVPPPTDAETDRGAPVFLDQLVDALRRGLNSSPEIGSSAVQHGHDLLLQGFTVSQVAGNVGVAGSTGTVLHRSLVGIRALIGRSLAEVRLTQGVQNPEQFAVFGFIDELAPAAIFGCTSAGRHTHRDVRDE